MNVRQALQILNVGGGYINIKDIPYSAIKTAYRKQALLFHPDKNKSDDAQEVFIEIKTAFDVLTSATNPTTRFSLGDNKVGDDDELKIYLTGFVTTTTTTQITSIRTTRTTRRHGFL
jgi:curved DNA-binding protein CbpA